MDVNRKYVWIALALVVVLAVPLLTIHAYSERHSAAVFGYPISRTTQTYDINTSFFPGTPTFVPTFLNDNNTPDLVAYYFNYSTYDLYLCVYRDNSLSFCKHYTVPHCSTCRVGWDDYKISIAPPYLYIVYTNIHTQGTSTYHDATLFSVNLYNGSSNSRNLFSCERWHNSSGTYASGCDLVYPMYVLPMPHHPGYLYILYYYENDSDYSGSNYTENDDYYYRMFIVNNTSVFKDFTFHHGNQYDSSYGYSWWSDDVRYVLAPNTSTINLITQYRTKSGTHQFRYYHNSTNPSYTRNASVTTVSPYTSFPLDSNVIIGVKLPNSPNTFIYTATGQRTNTLDSNTPPFVCYLDDPYVHNTPVCHFPNGTFFSTIDPNTHIPTPVGMPIAFPSGVRYHNYIVHFDGKYSAPHYTLTATYYAPPPVVYNIDLNVLSVLDYDHNVSTVPVALHFTPVYNALDTNTLHNAVIYIYVDKNLVKSVPASTSPLDVNVPVSTPGDHKILIYTIFPSDTNDLNYTPLPATLPDLNIPYDIDANATILQSQVFDIHVLAKPYALTIYSVVPRPRDVYLAATAQAYDVNSPADLNYTWTITLYHTSSPPTTTTITNTPAIHLSPDINSPSDINSDTNTNTISTANVDYIKACLTVTDPHTSLSTTRCTTIDITKTTKNRAVIVLGPPKTVKRIHRYTLYVPVRLVTSYFTRLGLPNVSVPSQLSAVSIPRAASAIGLITVFAIIAYLIIH